MVLTAYLSVWMGRRGAGLVALVSCSVVAWIVGAISAIVSVESRLSFDLGVCL
jgi:hypothetical protein